MDTNRLKRFATEARSILMQGVHQRLKALGFSDKGIALEEPRLMEGGCVFMGEIQSSDFYNKWMSLNSNIQSKSIREVAEEAAYTWFNRFMAIRIMAKQEFISPILAYESDDIRVPAIVSEARQGRIPMMNESTHSQLIELLEDDSKTSEQFALLIVAYCHDNPIINKCFGAIADYTELLLPQNILSEGGFVDMINHTEFITDEQYASAELIGWLYQFYISDRKDEAFAKKGKYDPDEIAPATQIFTPNWIVKYMVENTLGRIYIDNNPYCEMKDDLKYLVDVKPSSEPLKIDDLSEMKVADLACGSGHILNECFDLLYKMYIEEGYSRQQAIKDILQKNLIGIDLDTRAKQLASFALLMKACQKDRSFLDGKVMPRIYNMPRPISEAIPSDWDTKVPAEFLKGAIPHYMLGCNDNMSKEIAEAILLMDNADTLGSIMKFDISESTRNAIMVRTKEYEEQLANDDFVPEANQLFIPYMNIILALTEKYAAICMNPPYMGSGRFDSVLSKYVKDNYPRSKTDLMSVFMDVAIDRLVPNGKYGMINMHSWMFLSSFEELRCNILEKQSIDSLLHLGPRTFDELSGEIVQNTAFIVANTWTKNSKATYYRLIDGNNCSEKANKYLIKDGEYKDVFQSEFSAIPGHVIGYWINKNVLDSFNSHSPINAYGDGRQGIIPGNASLFIHLWFEVSRDKIGFNHRNAEDIILNKKKWFPYNKGGGKRKWFGNNEYIIDFENNAYNIKHSEVANYRLRDPQLYFKEAVTWSKIMSDTFTARKMEEGYLFDSGGCCIFNLGKFNDNVLAFLNSRAAKVYMRLLSPTINYEVEQIGKIPYIENQVNNNLIDKCIDISKMDWNSHETSWDFQTNEIVGLVQKARNSGPLDVIWYDDKGEMQSAPCPTSSYSIQGYFDDYRFNWIQRFFELHQNEEELNRQFIEIYGLQDELTPEVPFSEITILQQGEITIKGNDFDFNPDVVMKQLISYAVGCMMGRYSIDKPGLILANQGDGLKEYHELIPESRFEPDDDGIIPLMSSNTEFTDDATKRFKTWVATTFGDVTLQDNLNFIRTALGKDIDDYFVKDFWKDHKKMYQNRPIYWLFSSKKGAFQCLAYMHRMTPYTAEQVRTKYLLPHIEWLMNKENEMMENAFNLSARERKELDSISAQIKECREYHDRLHVIADQQIDFDLDDGVVVNYAKFGDVLQKLK